MLKKIVSSLKFLFEKPLKYIYQEITEEKPSSSRFDFLDGYRGSLVFFVVISHTQLFDSFQINHVNSGFAHTYSITGFFTLSAFLLTYRLLEDFNKASSPKMLLISIIKYAIRRFFRIYVYFLFYFAFAKFSSSSKWIIRHVEYNNSLLNVSLLGNTGANHLWTIPPEIKYYLFIPIFCLIVYLLNRLSAIILLVLCMTWTIYDQSVNFFELTPNDIYFGSPRSHLLKSQFTVFFIGSQTALIYIWVKNCDWLMSRIRTWPIQCLLNYTSIIIALVGLIVSEIYLYDSFRFRSRQAPFWSAVLLLTLLSAENNMIANVFRNSFLRNLGKFSYSIYLFHFDVITISIKFLFFLKWFEFALVCVLLCYFIGMVLFYLIENHLIQLANYLCEKVDSIFGGDIEYKPVLQLI